MVATTLTAAMPARQGDISGNSFKKNGRELAWLASLLLHAALLLFALEWIVPHETKAPSGRQIGPVISLGTLLKPDQSGAAQAILQPPAARPHAARARRAKAAPPPAAAPSPQPTPTQVAEAAIPQPQTTADPGPPAPAADPAPAAAAQGASSSPARQPEYPYAYLNQISLMINAHLGPEHAGCIGHKRQTCQTAIVHLCIDRNGIVISAGLIGSAGSRDFDQQALDAIRRVGSFPPPPADIMASVAEFVVDQPVLFYRG